MQITWQCYARSIRLQQRRHPCTECLAAGYVLPPLSRRNLVPHKLLFADPVPWSESLRKNGADDVLCLPFSVSPLRLIEAARSMSLADATLSSSFRFEPSSVKETMVSITSCRRVKAAEIHVVPRRWRHIQYSCRRTSYNIMWTLLSTMTSRP